MTELDYINFTAHILDEAMEDKTTINEVDLSNFEGTMTDLIRTKIVEPLNTCKTKDDVYSLVKIIFAEHSLDTFASRRLLLNIQRSSGLFSALKTVTDSMLYGSDLGVNDSRRRACESDISTKH